MTTSRRTSLISISGPLTVSLHSTHLLSSSIKFSGTVCHNIRTSTFLFSSMTLEAATHKHPPPLFFLFCFSSPANLCLKVLLVTFLTKARLLVCSKHCLPHWPTPSHGFLALLYLSVAVCRQLWSSHIVSSCGTMAFLLVFISTLSHKAEACYVHRLPTSC